MNTTATKKEKTIEADTTNSTYRWVMYLDDSHKLEHMVGWSKVIGWDERKDKFEHLMGCIVRLTNSGYLSTTKRIEIYTRLKTDAFYNIKTEVKFLILKPNDYILHLPDSHPKKRDLVIFLDKLYKSVLQGISVKYLIPTNKTNFSKDDYLDWKKQDFFNNIALENYCVKMVKSGHAFGAVEHFRQQYLQNKPFRK